MAFDEAEFLSPHGLRALSRRHLEHPLDMELAPGFHARLGYEPGESQTGLFGGNSNWRGPVWFPPNYLFIEALRRFHDSLGDDFTIAFPTGSDHVVDLREAARLLADRLVGLFRVGPDGRRPVFGGPGIRADHPRWRDLIPFHEYFHGDTGAGLGASHQTGWTGLVADLIRSSDTRARPGPGGPP